MNTISEARTRVDIDMQRCTVRDTDSSRLPDITMVGVGLCEDRHLTREAIDVLEAARVVFTSRYSQRINDIARQLNTKARILDLESGEYRIGAYRPSMYRRMADRICREAARGSGVVVLQPGSAMVVDTVTQMVLESARLDGLSVRITPGVSSVESVLAEVGYDLMGGLQVFLAQRLVLEQRTVDPMSATLILQPGYFDTRYWLGLARSKRSRFEDLHKLLSKTLVPETEAALIMTPIRAYDRPRVFWFLLQNLNELYDHISPFDTLFIRPKPWPRWDDDFEQRIDTWEVSLSSVNSTKDGTPLEDPSHHLDHGAFGSLDADLRRESSRIEGGWNGRDRQLLGEEKHIKGRY